MVAGFLFHSDWVQQERFCMLLHSCIEVLFFSYLLWFMIISCFFNVTSISALSALDFILATSVAYLRFLRVALTRHHYFRRYSVADQWENDIEATLKLVKRRQNRSTVLWLHSSLHGNAVRVMVAQRPCQCLIVDSEVIIVVSTPYIAKPW